MTRIFITHYGCSTLNFGNKFICKYFYQRDIPWFVCQWSQKQIAIKIVLIATSSHFILYFIDSIEWLCSERRTGQTKTYGFIPILFKGCIKYTSSYGRFVTSAIVAGHNMLKNGKNILVTNRISYLCPSCQFSTLTVGS